MDRQMATNDWQLCKGVGFDECFRRHYRTLCYFAYRYLREREGAEDVVQDVFTALLEERRVFADEEHLLRFLYVSTRNACLNVLKLNDIHAEALAKAAPREEASEDEFFAKVVRAEVYREIMAAIDELPRECGRAFRLTCVDGLSNEAAAELGVSVNTVKVQKNRAKIQLRQRLKGLYPLLLLFCDAL